MALLFMDSFDHYATADILGKWAINNGGTIQPVNGRRGSGALRLTGPSGVVTCGMGAGVSGATAIMGLAVRPISQNAPVKWFGFYDGLNSRDQVFFYWNSDNSISAYRGFSTIVPGTIQGGATFLGTTSSPLVNNAYTYVEVRVVIDPTVGSVRIRFNGAVVLDLTGINTSNGSTVWNTIFLGSQGNSGGNGTSEVDDLYVLDGAGPAPWNTFLGDCRVDARFATAVGATTQWTATPSVPNWQNIDDATPNGDTDYNTAPTAGLTDTFVVQDAPVAGAALFGVQHCLSLKKLDAGTCTVGAVVRHAGVNYVSPDVGVSTGYLCGRAVQPTNPGTGAQWTLADFNAAEFGYQKIT